MGRRTSESRGAAFRWVWWRKTCRAVERDWAYEGHPVLFHSEVPRTHSQLEPSIRSQGQVRKHWLLRALIMSGGSMAKKATKQRLWGWVLDRGKRQTVAQDISLHRLPDHLHYPQKTFSPGFGTSLPPLTRVPLPTCLLTPPLLVQVLSDNAFCKPLLHSSFSPEVQSQCPYLPSMCSKG